MKFNILHIFILVVVSIGVISGDDNGIIVNGNNKTDVPTASTVINSNTSTSPIPPTTVDPKTSTIDPNTTTVDPKTTTVDPKTTTVDPKTTTVDPKTTTVDPKTTTVDPKTTTTSTITPSNVTTTTESTTSVPTSAPSHKGRRFDGPSFIGGIILASGLMAICFVSWKFYKARTERNYHTL